jgi:hypothetical protein
MGGDRTGISCRGGCSRPVLICRKSGKHAPFSLSRRARTTPGEHHQTTVIAELLFLSRSKPKKKSVSLYSSKSPGFAAGVEMVRSLI